mgnify:CR=1 FL=1
MNHNPISIPLRERQLFLDDDVIKEVVNLSKTMHSPVKRGTVIRPDPGEHALQTRCAPFWDPDPKVFKYWVGGYRESHDGVNWRKVAHAQNMEVAKCVFYDPTDPDSSRRYKAWQPDAFHVSGDGSTWRQLEVKPISVGDDYNFSVDLDNRLYIATVKHSAPDAASRLRLWGSNHDCRETLRRESLVQRSYVAINN